MQEQMTQDDEINLLEYWGVIRKRWKFIISLMLIVAFAVAVRSLFMDNIYQASAVIAPVESKDRAGGMSSLAAQFGGLAGIAGISMPGSASLNEIKSLLNSKVLKEKVIEQNNLLPVLFPDAWDEEKGAWKKPGKPMFLLGVLSDLKKKVKAMASPKKPARGDAVNQVGPTIWDGLRALDQIMKVSIDQKTSMITVSAELNDPEIAAKLVEYFLAALTDHMSSEAKRVARTNRAYLEEQLLRTADPVVRQKINSLLGQQVETMLMAEVKENFAFKVIDRPMVPDRKIKPKRAQMVVLSSLLAAFIGVFLAFFLEYLEKVRKSE